MLTVSQIPREEIKGFKTVLPKGNDPGFAQELGHVQALVQRYHVGEVDIGGVSFPLGYEGILL